MNKYEKVCQKLKIDIENKKRVSPLKAIRCKCLDCVCYQSSEITRCPILDCPLYNFRSGANKTGKNPSRRK